jgi:hypothetical protein
MAPAVAERIFPAAGGSLARSVIALPQQLALDGTENLRVHLRARTLGDCRCILTGRYRRESDGGLQVFQEQFIGSSGSTLDAEVSLDAGVLLNLRLTTDAIATKLGALFGRVSLIRGSGAGVATVVATLIQGYFNLENERAWPGSPLESMHDGRGICVNGLWGVFPAPLRLLVTLGSQQRWRLIGGTALVSTSAVPGTRTVYVRALNGSGALMWQGTSGIAQLASTTINYNVGAGQQPTGIMGAGIALLPWPTDLELEPGAQLELVVDNDQVGDALTGLALQVREWMDK